MKKISVFLLLLACMACNTTPAEQTEKEPPVLAPFENLDTLATNDWWNRGNSRIIDMKVERDQVVAFGIYTVSEGVLKLSAQLFPLYPEETRTVRLEVKKGENWEEIQKKHTVPVNAIGVKINPKDEKMPSLRSQL